MMEKLMKEKDRIKEELAELLDTYYNGSFPQMACDYMRSTGMTLQEMEELLETIKQKTEQ